MRRDKPNAQSKTSLSPSRREQSHTSSSPGEQIKFLKSKLIDTHNRLMEQLDLTKQQEKKIMQLATANEVLKEQLNERSYAEGPSALKSKLKAQIHEKNRLKEELSFLAEKYTELEEASKKHRGDDRSTEGLRKKVLSLEADNSKLKKQIQDIESDKALIRQKAADLEKHVKQERQINRGLTEENKNLQAKLFNVTIKSQSLEEENIELRNNRQQLGNKGQTQKLRRQVERLRNQLKDRSEDVISISEKQPKRKPVSRNFNETQQLIKRLEQAQIMTRTRNSKSINKLKKLERQMANNDSSQFLPKQLTFDQNNSEAQPRKTKPRF